MHKAIAKSSLSYVNHNRFWCKNKIVLIIFFLILVFFLSKFLTQERVIIINNSGQASRFFSDSENPIQIISANSSLSKLSSNKERINAIFLGIPGQGNNAPELTDTLMVISYNQDNNNGILLSIPRDLLVKIPETGLYTKINQLYQRGGVETIESVLSKITGLDFNYKIVIDLEGVKKIIDEIGGIDIFVEEEIYDPAFPGANSSYQLFILKEGWHHLDGETAIKYIRTRHNPTGDFARMARQQKVLMAIKEKIVVLNPIINLPLIANLWRAIDKHFQTNLSLQNIKSFLKLAEDIGSEKIKFEVLDPTTGLVAPDHIMLGGQSAYILKPTAGLENYKEIQNYIANLIEQY